MSDDNGFLWTNVKCDDCSVIGDFESCSPFAWLITAHAELLGARLHAAAHHQAVAWLEDVQWARNARVRHRADEDGNIGGQAEGKTQAQRHIQIFQKFSGKNLGLVCH